MFWEQWWLSRFISCCKPMLSLKILNTIGTKSKTAPTEETTHSLWPILEKMNKKNVTICEKIWRQDTRKVAETGQNQCYRQILPIITVTVQKSSPLKTSQAGIQSNRFKKNYIQSKPIIPSADSEIMSWQTWPGAVWCFTMTSQGARQPDAIMNLSNISTE